jgi:hypothetical protein
MPYSVMKFIWHLESSVCYLLHVGALLGLFFAPLVVGDVFLRNVSFHQATQHYIPEDRTLHLVIHVWHNHLVSGLPTVWHYYS